MMQIVLCFLKESLQRWGSESPKHFKQLQWASIIIFVISSGLDLLIKLNKINFTGSGYVETGLSWLAATMVGTFIASKTSTTDPKLMDVKSKENVIEDAQK